MVNYYIKHIAEIVGGRMVGQGAFIEKYPVEYLLTDSRRVAFPERSLFFAIASKRRDGHDYLKSGYEKGIRRFVISDEGKIRWEDTPEAQFVTVGDVLGAAQALATYHRREFPDLRVTGITGSNGKTVVKEWLFQLLSGVGESVVRSPKSYNSQLGVALSVWQIRAGHEVALFEAGVSQRGEMRRLAPMIDCETGVFTMIGDAHSEGFGSVEEKIAEKLDLFEHARVLIYPKDDERIDRAIRKRYGDKRLVSWSKRMSADLEIREERVVGSHTSIEGLYRGAAVRITIPFTDAASIHNAITCWLYMLEAGYGASELALLMGKLEPVAMRLELKAGINQCLVVNDAYNSDLASLEIALDFMGQQSAGKAQTLILSDMLQTGLTADALYERVGQLIVKKNVRKLIGVGKDIPCIRKYLPSGLSSRFFEQVGDLLQEFHGLGFRDEIILLKGARVFEFERLAERLSQKLHKTVLEINLSALAQNLRMFSQRLNPGVKMMAMVKASAYGSGGDEVARLLEFHKADYLSVAYADEGVQIRQAGVGLPIMVLNPEADSFDSILRYGLEPEIYSMSLLRQFIRSIESFAASQAEGDTLDLVGTFSIHLKLDTGMRRLGFEKAHLPELLNTLQLNPHIRVQTVFSHLAASEANIHDPFTLRQIGVFHDLYQEIALGLGYRPLRHVLNSAGIVRFPQFQLDMVRLGAGLYGIGSGTDIQLGVALTLKATVSQIKEVPAGESVGYGRRWFATRPTRTATISIGYADGLPRSVGNERFCVAIRGKRVPIVGNVCMDVSMIDVTDVPEAEEGDEVEIFGLTVPVEQLAAAANTIAYEIFTGISGRVKRIYFQE